MLISLYVLHLSKKQTNVLFPTWFYDKCDDNQYVIYNDNSKSQLIFFIFFIIIVFRNNRHLQLISFLDCQRSNSQLCQWKKMTLAIKKS